MKVCEIMALLPHRYPMLLVDRILEVVPGKSSVGLKNVSLNEPFFAGHFPGRPMMPGVLILEAMAQAGAIALMADEANAGLMPVMAASESVKITRPVYPGDQLISTGELLWLRHGVGKMTSKATVDGETVAVADLIFKMVPR